MISKPGRSGTYWTTSEKRFLEENYLAKGGVWCAEKLNRTTIAVRRYAKQYGIARRIEAYRHPSSPEMDAVIRRAYQSGEVGANARCARALQKSPSWVSHRAMELGLTLRLTRNTPWSKAELAFIEANKHHTRKHISRMMRDRGWKRTAYAVWHQLKQAGLTGPSETHMSASAAAECFGIHRNRVLRWIAEGLIIATRQQFSKDCDAIPYIIEDVELARFAVRHPTMIDLRRVNGPWFIDLIARHGAAGLVEAKDKASRIIAIKQAFPDRKPAEIAAMVDSTAASVAVTLSKARTRQHQRAA